MGGDTSPMPCFRNRRKDVMRIKDGALLSLYAPEDEGHHRSGPQPDWQESVVLVWWDPKQRVGGIHRIGHETNRPEGPMAALWNVLISPAGVYRKTSYQPLLSGDSDGFLFGCGDDSCAYDVVDGCCTWTVADGEVSAKLRVEDAHAAADFYPKSGSLTDDFAPHHMEVSGRVVGELRIDGAVYPVDAVGIRDHGWGVRNWSSLLSHRWVVGALGDGTSFYAISWHGADDSMASFGWVVRGDVVEYAKSLDILAFVEIDAASVRGGRVRIELSGETLDIECLAVARSQLSYHHGVACVDTLCEMRCGDQVGYGDFETTSNIQAGTRRPVRMARGMSGDGLFPGEQ
jgi:hypothetical protein